jgi:hypothetical protein
MPLFTDSLIVSILYNKRQPTMDYPDKNKKQQIICYV